MKFLIHLVIPEEMIENYQIHLDEKEPELGIDLKKTKVQEELIKDIVQEQTGWQVTKIQFIEDITDNISDMTDNPCKQSPNSLEKKKLTQNKDI
jgi:hypothetical protein